MNVSKLQQPQAAAPAGRITLANAKRGRVEVPIKVLVYGTDGVGKSTFAAGAPSPFFITLDDRTFDLDIARSNPKPQTFSDVLGWFRVLENEKHDYKTVVIDPVSWLEPLINLQITGDPNMPISKWDGGYGRGSDAVVDQVRIFVAAAERLWSRGMNVIMTAHCTVKKFNDPAGPEYDRYEVALDKRAAGVLKQWSDFVLFAKHEAIAQIGDAKTKRVRGQATGRHVAYTKWTAAYDAKFTGSGPTSGEMPLSWRAFEDAVVRGGGAKAVADLRSRIDALVAEINDEEVTKKAAAFVTEAGSDGGRLEEIANGLLMKLEEVKAEGAST